MHTQSWEKNSDNFPWTFSMIRSTEKQNHWPQHSVDSENGGFFFPGSLKLKNWTAETLCSSQPGAGFPPFFFGRSQWIGDVFLHQAPTVFTNAWKWVSTKSSIDPIEIPSKIPIESNVCVPFFDHCVTVHHFGCHWKVYENAYG